MIEGAFYSAVPLVLAALGGLLSERAGVLNISLEGCIGAGAFTTAVMIGFGIPPWLAVPAAMVVGVLAGLILAGAHLGLGANLFIAGLGLNLLLPSLSGLISQGIFGHKGILRIESSNHFLLPWMMIPAALLTAFLLHRTAIGRRVRAAGSGEAFLAERGISARRIRLFTLLVSSGLAAAAGAFLSLRIGAYVPGMSSGKGWIALVMIWMGFRRPIGILISGYIFALFEIASGRVQGLVDAQASLMLALPYIAALVALVLLSAGGFKRRGVEDDHQQ